MSQSCRCLVCASAAISPLLETFSVPADTCRIWPSQRGARAAVRGPVDISYCADCGHVFNCSYNDDMVDYETDYENSQMFSPRFRGYAEELADRLIAAHDLHGKHILEIGGGRGDFLRIICDRGNNFGVSFGPSYRPAPSDHVPENLRFITDYYGEKYAHEPADLIICRHVLEHFWEPRQLVTAVRQAVADRRNLVVYFEVPNGEHILRNRAFWEFIYQHCSYFTRSSLARLFTDCGFEVRDIYESFENQFLAIEVSAGSETPGANSNGRTEYQPGAPAIDGGFRTVFGGITTDWRQSLQRLQAEGKRVVAWGAGARAVTFLNIVDPAGSVVSHIVDINPRKKGRFVPGSGQEIVAPNSLPELRPEVIVLMNGVYRGEVASTVRELGLSPEILVAQAA